MNTLNMNMILIFRSTINLMNLMNTLMKNLHPLIDIKIFILILYTLAREYSNSTNRKSSVNRSKWSSNKLMKIKKTIFLSILKKNNSKLMMRTIQYIVRKQSQSLPLTAITSNWKIISNYYSRILTSSIHQETKNSQNFIHICQHWISKIKRDLINKVMICSLYLSTRFLRS